MSEIREGLYYTKDHEWVKAEGNEVYIGITDHAQEALGDIVFAQGEPIGTRLRAGQTVGVVESVKAASDVYTPVSGVVLEVNDGLSEAPELVNSKPYESWIVKFKIDDKSELNALMDATAYKTYCGEEG